MLITDCPNPALASSSAGSAANLAGACCYALSRVNQLVDPRIAAGIADSVVETKPAELLLDLVDLVAGRDCGDISVELGNDRPPTLSAVHGFAPASGEACQHRAKYVGVVVAHVWDGPRPVRQNLARVAGVASKPFVVRSEMGNNLEVGRRGWDDQTVLRVYLDQNKWIDLSRSRKGGFTDDLADAWHLALAGVERGLLPFPLSAIHYYETTKRRDQRSRWELAATMAELSRMHTIAGPNTLVPLEVNAAVAKLVPGAPPPAPIQAFGVGAAHALGAAPNRFDGLFCREELRAAGVPNDMLDAVHHGLVDAVEFAVLALTEYSPNAQEIVAQTRAHMEAVNRKFADAQRSFAEGVARYRLTHRRDEGLTRFDFADIIPLFNRACVARGVVPNPEQFKDIELVERILRDIPSKWIVREMRRVRHRNPQQPWTDSDLNDVNALSGAVVYCDVVVTERQWARHLNHEGLAELHGSTVISDLRELPELLVAYSTV